jgi:hypothetical protein
MQEAIEPFAGSLKIVEETSQAGLTAVPCGDERKHKIYEGLALMAVCIVKDQVDILNKATGWPGPHQLSTRYRYGVMDP